MQRKSDGHYNLISGNNQPTKGEWGSMVRRRLFIHTTFDCRFDGVCRDDCYLLAGKSDEDKQIRLPDEYWVNVVELAGQYGFEELSLPINPLKGVTGIKEPLHWLRLLAPVAKKYGMVINVTTTMEVAQHILPSDQVDIVAISVDEYRVGKDWKKKSEKLARVTKYLRHIGVEVNANVSLDLNFVRTFVMQYEYWEFLKNSFDYTTVLIPKAPPKEVTNQMLFPSGNTIGFLTDTAKAMFKRPLVLRELLANPGLTLENLGWSFHWVPQEHEDRGSFLTALQYHTMVKDRELIGSNGYMAAPVTLSEVQETAHAMQQFFDALHGVEATSLIDYCLAHKSGEITCDAGHGQLSLDARGWLAICPYNNHYLDVSNLDNFERYLRDTIPVVENIPYCDLVETTRLQREPDEDYGGWRDALDMQADYVIGHTEFYQR